MSSLVLHHRKNKKSCRNTAVSFYQTNNLVSDLPTVANYQDVNLINPWGIAVDNDDTIWVADNATGRVTHYNFLGNTVSAPLLVPGAGNMGVGAPTGIIVNQTTGFVITSGPNSASARLIVANEDGTINAYNGMVDPLNFVQVIDNSSSGAVYKGIAQVGNFIYATDFFNRTIDVFDFNFAPVFVFPFIDTGMINPIPADFAPFGIKNINNKLYVTYAKQNPPTNTDDLPGVGNGYVNVYTANGLYIRRLASNGPLNSPWGIEKAPEGYGQFEDKILVGNFGDGLVNVYNFHGQHLGNLAYFNSDIQINGLWGLATKSHNSRFVFFAAGINNEANGLVGTIENICLKDCKCSSI